MSCSSSLRIFSSKLRAGGTACSTWLAWRAPRAVAGQLLAGKWRRARVTARGEPAGCLIDGGCGRLLLLRAEDAPHCAADWPAPERPPACSRALGTSLLLTARSVRSLLTILSAISPGFEARLAREGLQHRLGDELDRVCESGLQQVTASQLSQLGTPSL